jgi:hypothetical protein
LEGDRSVTQVAQDSGKNDELKGIWKLKAQILNLLAA